MGLIEKIKKDKKFRYGCIAFGTFTASCTLLWLGKKVGYNKGYNKGYNNGMLDEAAWTINDAKNLKAIKYKDNIDPKFVTEIIVSEVKEYYRK